MVKLIVLLIMSRMQPEVEMNVKKVLVMVVMALTAIPVWAVDVTPFSNGKPQFPNNNGAACAGCLLYTYAAGTTTPQATYTDSTGTSANTNPVVLDSSGRANIWMASAAYKFDLKTASGVEIWTVDRISSWASSPSITGRVTITVTNNSLTALSVNNSGTGGFGANFVATGTNAVGLLASGPLVAIRGTSTAGTVFEANAISGLGTQFGIAVKDSLGTRNFGVTDTGNLTSNGSIANNNFSAAVNGKITTAHGIAINGATEITAQSGTGGTVAMTAAPSFTGTTNFSGQINSTIATGTSPFAVTSTTPVANLTTIPVTYDLNGSQQVNAHLVKGTCTLGTDCAVTLAGSAVFSSSSSYNCYAQDATAAAATKVAYTSGTQFTITGTGTDSIRWSCLGN